MGKIWKIGKTSDNDIVLNSPYVSDHHAEISCYDGTYVLTDHSQNGTTVNDQMVHGGSLSIKFGDIVLFAGVVQFNWNIVNQQSTLPQNPGFDNPTGGFGGRTCEPTSQPQPQPKPSQEPQSSFVTFPQAVRICLKQKYACFEGRAKRSEYWFYALFNYIISLAATFVGLIIGLIVALCSDDYYYYGAIMYGVMYAFLFLVSLAFLCPSISVAVRRLHDTGRSGAYYFLALIPIVGAILLLVYFIQPSQPEDNQYGEYIP